MTSAYCAIFKLWNILLHARLKSQSHLPGRRIIIIGTLPVTVYGDWLPRHIMGRFHALFAYLRMCYTALMVLLLEDPTYDVVFCDQVSACIPVLRLGRAKVAIVGYLTSC